MSQKWQSFNILYIRSKRSWNYDFLLRSFRRRTLSPWHLVGSADTRYRTVAPFLAAWASQTKYISRPKIRAWTCRRRRSFWAPRATRRSCGNLWTLRVSVNNKKPYTIKLTDFSETSKWVRYREILLYKKYLSNIWKYLNSYHLNTNPSRTESTTIS